MVIVLKQFAEEITAEEITRAYTTRRCDYGKPDELLVASCWLGAFFIARPGVAWRS
jgi:hypothetical protein